MGVVDTISTQVQRPADQVAELFVVDSDDVEPRGSSGGAVSTAYRQTLTQFEAAQDYQIGDYRILYEDGPPIISEAVNIFASKVVEPGWYITADSTATREELTEFFAQVAVINRRPGQDFAPFAEKLVIEREVRGTAFVEKVTNDDDRYNSLYPLQNETITIYSKPGKAMLAAPDDDRARPSTIDKLDDDRLRTTASDARVPKTDSGETGAFVQFDDVKPMWDDRSEVVFTRDDVIHWPRDADIGDARGTSRFAGVIERTESLLQKLRDNDDAIAAKAWPMILFQMGSEDNPWTEEEVEDFIADYDESVFGPGMMQAVSGDIGVAEFGGETADISDSLKFDVNMISAGMPGPKYAVGAFADDVPPHVAEAMEREFMKEVRTTRHELEMLFTPFLRDVARQYNLDAPDSVELHVDRPDGDVAPEDVRGNIIRYETSVGSDDEDGGSSDGSGTSEDGSGTGGDGFGDGSNGSTEDDRIQSNDNRGNNEVVEDFRHTGPVGVDDEELVDPRHVLTSDIQRDVASVGTEVLVDCRDALIERDAQPSSIVLSVLDLDAVDRAAQQAVSEAVDRTIDTMGQDNHGPQMTVARTRQHDEIADTYRSNIRTEVERAAVDMARDAETIERRVGQQDRPDDDSGSILRDRYDRDTLERRVSTIAHMELQGAVNTVKVQEYRSHDDIDGIRVINPCTQNTTRLCRHLAACDGGEAATAWFDEEGGRELGRQLTDRVASDLLFEGFDPLPPTPPFHFNCRSSIVPAQRNT